MIGTKRRATMTMWNGMKYIMMPLFKHRQMWQGTDANSRTLRMNSKSGGRNVSTLDDGLAQTRAVLWVGIIL